MLTILNMHNFTLFTQINFALMYLEDIFSHKFCNFIISLTLHENFSGGYYKALHKAQKVSSGRESTTDNENLGRGKRRRVREKEMPASDESASDEENLVLNKMIQLLPSSPVFSSTQTAIRSKEQDDFIRNLPQQCTTNGTSAQATSVPNAFPAENGRNSFHFGLIFEM